MDIGRVIYQFLTSALLPLPVIISLIVIGLMLKKYKPWLSRSILLSSFAALIILSLPVTSAKLIHSLERQHPPRNLSEVPSGDIIVLMAGGVNTASHPRQHAELGACGDRILTAFRLLQANKSERIIIAGNASTEKPGVDSEAQATHDILVELGVEPNRILKAVAGRTTRETAGFAANQSHQLEVNTMLLVTSAYHMPRTLQLFQKLAPEVIPVTSNHLITSNDQQTTEQSAEQWIPSAISLSGSTLAIKEYLGMLVNRWVP